MAFDPESAVASYQPQQSSGFDPESAMAAYSPQQETAPGDELSPTGAAIAKAASYIPGVQALANNPGLQQNLSPINAIGSGTQQAMANTVGLAVGSPNLTNQLGAPQITDQAAAEHPTLNLAGKIAGYVAPAAALGAATGGAADAMLGEGLLSDAVSNTLTGSILGGPDNRLFGAATGLLAVPIGQAFGAVGKYIANAATIKSKLNNVMAWFTSKIKGNPDEVAVKSQANMWKAASDIENKMAEGFKNTDVTTSPQYAANQAANILSKYNSPKQLGKLSSEQEDILKTIVNWGKPDAEKFSINDLHSARKQLDQVINQAWTKADSGEISRGVAKDLSSLRQPLENDLQNAADKAGVLDQYKEFNNYYKSKILPLINTGAKDTYETLKDSTDPMAAAKLYDKSIGKYVKFNQPQMTQEFLNSLDSEGRKAVEVSVLNRTLQQATDARGHIDPLKFTTAVDKLRNSAKGIFSPESSQMLDGLSKSAYEATHIGGTYLDLSKLSQGWKLGLAAGATGALGAGEMYNEAHGGEFNSYLLTAGALTILPILAHTKPGQYLLMQAAKNPQVAKSIANGALVQGALQLNPNNPPQ